MRKTRKSVRMLIALALSVVLFIIYIHSNKEGIIASAVVEANYNGVSINLQNPYIMPIKVYNSKVVNSDNNEIPVKAYSIILNGAYNGSSVSLSQAFMAQQTDVFEELDELTIPSGTSKREKSYTIFMENANESETIQSATEVSVSFKVFYLIPFQATIPL